ncbi:MAG: peptidoglycan bridge formation glycyltransferase FemA/FemB family protein [bacterium]
MTIKYFNDAELNQWQEFVKTQAGDFGLLQNASWGDLQIALGRKVFRIGVMDGDKIVLVAQAIVNPLVFGKTYFYIPRGPILLAGLEIEKQKEVLKFFLAELKSLAVKEKAILTRLDPAWFIDAIELTDFGYKKINMIQPKQTLILDLTLNEEALLSQMKAKTRYNIKVAQKSGVTIHSGAEYLADFLRLIKLTAERDEFMAHGGEYYQKMVAVLSVKNILEVVVAKIDNKVVTANLVINLNDWCVYLHGASDYEYRQKMAPYLLQWQTILKAKAQGKKYYDFWGVDEVKWPGVTRFKQGFAENAKFTDYVGAYETGYGIFWYNLYQLVKKIKK